MEVFFLVAAILVLTYFSGFFSASEIALFSLPSMKIKAYQSDTDWRKQLIAKLVLNPQDLLVTIFMLNTFVNILIQNVAANLFGDYSGWLYTVGVPLILTLVFGEVLPKHLALQKNTSIAYSVAPTINFMQNFIGPLRKWIIKVTTPISRILFFFLKKEPNISKDELQHMLDSSLERGVLDLDEAELIEGYLELQEKSVKEVMRPRAEVLFYNVHDPLTKLTYLFVDQECTRIPVCDHNLENVLGIITAHQFFLLRNEFTKPQDILKYISKPFFVPESLPARLLMRRLNERNEEIALVVDEYGSISGLIASEDLVEIVIGKISDRRDQHALYTRASNDVIIASGKLEISDFDEIFDVELDNPSGKHTIGGWLIERLEDIPKSGTKYESGNFLFHVLSAEPSRVTRLYIRMLKPKSNGTRTKEAK